MGRVAKFKGFSENKQTVYGISLTLESKEKSFNMFYALNTARIKCGVIRYAILVILLLVAIHVQGQKTSVSSAKVKTEFKNQGEQEDYWAQRLFDRDYKVEYYEKYDGPIILNGNWYQYKGVAIAVGTDANLRAIFNTGIFYPDVMNQAFISQSKIHIKINKDSLLAWQKRDTLKIKSIFPKTDSLSITDFEELKLLEKKPTQRRFKFWLFRKGFANPIVYFMELTNENATTETKLLPFINGAKLTFFQQGWVII